MIEARSSGRAAAECLEKFHAEPYPRRGPFLQ